MVEIESDNTKFNKDKSRNHSRSVSTYEKVQNSDTIKNDYDMKIDKINNNNNKLNVSSSNDLLKLNINSIFTTEETTNSNDVLYLDQQTSERNLINKDKIITELDEEYIQTQEKKVKITKMKSNTDLLDQLNSNLQSKPKISDHDKRSRFSLKKINDDIISDEILASNENLISKNNMQKPISADFIVDLRKKLNTCEDTYYTEQLYTKIKIDEILCTLLIIISIISSIGYRSLCYDDTDNCDNDNKHIVVCLAVSSISTLLYSIFFD